MTIEEKEENSATVNRIEGTKRGHGNRSQSRGTKTGREKTCQQQDVNSVIDVGWKDIFKSSAGQSRKMKKSKNKPEATGTPTEVVQIWLVATTKKRNQCMPLR